MIINYLALQSSHYHLTHAIKHSHSSHVLGLLASSAEASSEKLTGCLTVRLTVRVIEEIDKRSKNSIGYERFKSTQSANRWNCAQTIVKWKFVDVVTRRTPTVYTVYRIMETLIARVADSLIITIWSAIWQHVDRKPRKMGGSFILFDSYSS